MLKSRWTVNKRRPGLLPTADMPDTKSGNPTENSNRVGEPEYTTFFDDPDVSSIKMGAPYVGIYGKIEAGHKCNTCQNTLQSLKWGEKMVMFCPWCRKTMFRSVDDSGRFNYEPSLESAGPELGWNLPTPSMDNYAGQGNRDGYNFP